MSKLKIKEITFEERENKTLYWRADTLKFDDLNLIIGPNASGKTQFLRRVAYIKEIHTANLATRNIKTNFKTSVKFELSDHDQNEQKKQITYKIEVSPGPTIHEEIFDDSGAHYFKVKNNEAFLYDEISKTEKSFLFNNSTSITKQVRTLGTSFQTISLIGDFFQSILFLHADKFNLSSIRLGKHEIIPSEDMENISSVVLNWKNSYPGLYKQLFSTYKTFFESVKDFDKKALVNAPQEEILALIEDGVNEKIPITEMSSGMVRILSILALPLVRNLPFKQLSVKFTPSLILIDEIDNGLDYERIGLIIDHLRGESEFYQIVVSSHSPVVCNFIEPQYWRVFRRKGVEVKITSPMDVEETRDFSEKSKKSNWELYKNHISKSGKYSIQ